ncbi:sensor histidine kinase [Oceanisphaera profunda]|uniref:sensor histidine kinase n=1 Tax=Oceanisphaera profunda TaxID=1416627 RepID=UPI00125F771F|nr:sensor histidine kinase [Oceanisphaera profunda]
MSAVVNRHPHLRRRLLLLSAVVLIGLSLLATGFMVSYSKKTADRSYDLMLNSAILQLANAVRHGEQGFMVDMPVSAFATLAQAPEDRVFYRISVNGSFLTGYAALPTPPPTTPSQQSLTQQQPVFFDALFSGEPVRVARLTRLNTERQPHDEIHIELAQTRLAREQLKDEILYPALKLILGLLFSALLLLGLGIYYALRPFTLIARALARRRPRDLTPLLLPVPKETLPLLHTINHFIARQQQMLERMESTTSVAAHQLRTPLASLRALSENARDEQDAAKRKTLLAGLIEQCDQLSLTVNHLLNQAMLDHRFHSQELLPLELNALAKKVCLALAVPALQRQVELSFEPATSPLWIQGDEIAITQMLNNLIDNAVAHAPVHTRVEILLRTSPAPAMLIRDLGPGIPHEEREKVFARFYRGSQHRYLGSGLGMAIARDVAEHHGAGIHLHDNEPSGLEVEIRFNTYRSTP